MTTAVCLINLVIQKLKFTLSFPCNFFLHVISIRCKVWNQTRLKLEAIIIVSPILKLKEGNNAIISRFGQLFMIL